MKKIYATCAFLLCINLVDAQIFTLQSNDLGRQITAKQVIHGLGCAGANQVAWVNALKQCGSYQRYPALLGYLLGPQVIQKALLVFYY